MLNIAEIDERIAALRENLRELIEQAAAYSGAADEELTSRRIADQEVELERLRKQRDELSKSLSAPQPSSLRQPERKGNKMSNSHKIKRHMEVIGADGVHIGIVDGVEDGRIRLTKPDSGEGRHKGHHHFIHLVLVADVEGQKVRLSANGALAVMMEEEESGGHT
jgi:hypothetical protein